MKNYLFTLFVLLLVSCQNEKNEFQPIPVEESVVAITNEHEGKKLMETHCYLCPQSMNVVGNGDFAAEAHQVFKNLRAVAQAAGGSLDDIVKLNAYLTDLGNFAVFNEVMAEYFTQPYPARAAIGVAALPKGVQVEADAVLVLDL